MWLTVLSLFLNINIVLLYRDRVSVNKAQLGCMAWLQELRQESYCCKYMYIILCETCETLLNKSVYFVYLYLWTDKQYPTLWYLKHKFVQCMYFMYYTCTIFATAISTANHRVSFCRIIFDLVLYFKLAKQTSTGIHREELQKLGPMEEGPDQPLLVLCWAVRRFSGDIHGEYFKMYLSRQCSSVWICLLKWSNISWKHE